jgi:hypothetical protein
MKKTHIVDIEIGRQGNKRLVFNKKQGLHIVSTKKTCKIEDVYTLLKQRPFSQECIDNPDLYDAYCLRIIETLED